VAVVIAVVEAVGIEVGMMAVAHNNKDPGNFFSI
jgi:hypothetical protein